MSRLRVVSLGSFCGVKFSIQRLGLGEAHLPFDWVRTTAEGVRHFLQSRFSDFFSIVSRVDVANLQVYRSERHSFWHDDISQAASREKLSRRIERFCALQQDCKDLLFVRSCTSTDELLEVEALYEQLCVFFGSGKNRRVLLLVAVDGQEDFQGPVVHKELPGVLFYAQPLVEDAASPESRAYCQAISYATDAALDVSPATIAGNLDVGFGLASSQAMSTQRGEKLIDVLRYCDAGMYTGYGDLQSFEEPGKQHIDLGAQRS